MPQAGPLLQVRHVHQSVLSTSENQVTPSKPDRWWSHRSYQRWLKDGVLAAEAYIERAAIHSMAKCYLQAGHKSTIPLMLACPIHQLSVVTHLAAALEWFLGVAQMGMHLQADPSSLIAVKCFLDMILPGCHRDESCCPHRKNPSVLICMAYTA